MTWTLVPEWASGILQQFIAAKGFDQTKFTIMGEGNDLAGKWAKVNILFPNQLYGPYTIIKATDTEKAQVVNNMTWEVWSPD